MGRLNAKQLKDLNGELAALILQQSNARLDAVFVPMIQEKMKAFDLRKERIAEIFEILSKHDARR